MRVAVRLLAVLLLVCAVARPMGAGKSERTDNAARVAQRFQTLAKAKGWTVAYSDRDNPTLVATVNWPMEGFTTHLHLLDVRGRVLWSAMLPDQYIETVFPWLGGPDDPTTFVIVTHGGAGVGYWVRIVGVIGGKGRLLAKETGWGLAPVPEVALFESNRPSIILASMNDYKRPHRKAIVLSWDPKRHQVTKRTVAWKERFDLARPVQ